MSFSSQRPQGRRNRLWLWIAARVIAASVIAAAAGYAQTPNELLSEADRLAEHGNWFGAAPLYAKAEREFQHAGDRRNALYARFGRLHREAESGSYRAVRDQVVRDLTDPTVEGDPQLKIRALALLGTIDLNLDTDAAGDDWKQLLEVATAAGDRKWQNRANGELGLVAGLRGNIGAAGSALYQAVMKAEQLGDTAGEVSLATWIANGMSVNGMADVALQILAHAEDLARKNGFAEMPLQFSIAKVRALLQLSEPQRAHGREEARKLLATTLDSARSSGVSGAETELLNQAGQLALEDRDFTGAEKSFKEVVQISKAADLPREEADGFLHLSQLYRTEAAPANAVLAINHGIEVLRGVEEAYDFPTYVAEKAEVEAALGQLTTADALYDQATDLIDGLLVNAQTSRVKTDMIAAVGDIYVGHFRLAWDRLHDPEKAFRIVESARGRSVLDSIRYARQSGPLPQVAPGEQEITRLQRELVQRDLSAAQRHKLLDQLDYAFVRRGATEYAENRKEMGILRRAPVSLSAIRRQLAANESLIEFVLDTKKSYALEVSQAGLAVHELPGRAQIDGLVTQFLRGVKSKQETGDVAKALYNRVLSPALAKRTTSVIIVPDGSLHLVPFAALMDGDGADINGRVAIESVPSATVYFTLKTAPVQTAAARPFLGVAYSPPQSAAVQFAASTRGLFDLGKVDLKPLQSAREEIGEAARVLGRDSVTLDGGDASEAALKALALRDFKVIHIAAHGIVNESEPDRAALLLAPGNDAEDGLWQSREIRQARLNADLVVLSACETGTGRLEGQEGIMNLARAFLIAGAKSVVASLWQVDDRSTATLMGFFYEHLAAGLEIREALRQAQLDFIKEFGNRAQPYYWAGFEVIGDGTRRINFKTDKLKPGPAKANIR
jgi:CHAT domain-containing protein